MQNPYAPPKAEELGHPGPTTTLANKILRALACLSLLYLAVILPLNNFNPVPVRIATGIVFALLAIGVYLRGHKFHLGVSIFMLISIVGQIHLMKSFLNNQELQTLLGETDFPFPIPPNPWLDLFIDIIPHLIIVITTYMLFWSRPKNQQRP